MIALRALAPFSLGPTHAGAAPICELCGSPLPERHAHVVEIGTRGAQCACRACAILFTRADSDARFRTVPERFLADPAFAMSARRWAELGIPVRLAFIQRDSRQDRALLGYPGPAGITDAELSPEAWSEIAEATPLAAALEDDVEALVFHGDRHRDAMRCHLLPITAAYELVGRLRASWQGFSGGEQVERELAEFFAMLQQRGGRR